MQYCRNNLTNEAHGPIDSHLYQIHYYFPKESVSSDNYRFLLKVHIHLAMCYNSNTFSNTLISRMW